MQFAEFLKIAKEFLNHQLFVLAGTPVSVATLLTFIAIVLVTYASSKLVGKAIERYAKRRNIADTGSIQVTTRLTHYLILAVGFSIGLQTIGINLSALFAAGAVFAVGLGFAMQNIAQNFVSGVILLVERTIKPGDILEVEGRMVQVIRMGIRSTVARTPNDEEVIIPNALLVQGIVTNFTMRNRNFRLRAQVGVAYESDLKQVEQRLLKAAHRCEPQKSIRSPSVLLKQFGDSSVNFEISLWINNPWLRELKTSELLMAIWEELNEANICIAYPQLDVHLSPETTQQLTQSLAPSTPAH